MSFDISDVSSGEWIVVVLLVVVIAVMVFG